MMVTGTLLRMLPKWRAKTETHLAGRASQPKIPKATYTMGHSGPTLTQYSPVESLAPAKLSEDGLPSRYQNPPL